MSCGKASSSLGEAVVTGLGTQGLPSCGFNRETSPIPAVCSLSHTAEKRLGYRLPLLPRPCSRPQLPSWLAASPGPHPKGSHW